MKRILFMTALIAAPVFAHATEDEDMAKHEAQVSVEAKRPAYEAALKEKYDLSDDQLKVMHDKGMNDTQITMAAQLAKASGKSIEDVTKMRLEDKQGWGKIAKELGVAPGTLGQGIADMHRRERATERRAERRERREERAEKREERKAERAERREKRGKGE